MTIFKELAILIIFAILYLYSLPASHLLIQSVRLLEHFIGAYICIRRNRVIFDVSRAHPDIPWCIHHTVKSAGLPQCRLVGFLVPMIVIEVFLVVTEAAHIHRGVGEDVSLSRLCHLYVFEATLQVGV
jgi:hypothetical protein